MGRYAMRLNPLARAVRSKLHWAAIAFLLNTSSPYHPIVFPQSPISPSPHHRFSPSRSNPLVPHPGRLGEFAILVKSQLQVFSAGRR